MKKVIDFIKEHNYLMILLIFIGFSISLSLTYSNFIVTSNNHKAAEMYIGELKYSIEIDGSTTNTLTVPVGETIIDVKVNNLNPVDTYYKLLYLKNTNITVKYYESTKDTDEVVTTYNKPNDSVTSSNSNTIKLLITNSSTSSQDIALTMKGGYITNTLSDITTPSTYSEITLVEIPSTNTYFCKTNDTLTQGLQYVNGQYTYAYKQEYYDSHWENIINEGWGIHLSNWESTDAVTSRLCTYVNNKPIVSMQFMFFSSQATSIDLSSFNTSNVTNMHYMFSWCETPSLDLSNFNKNKVTDMSYMFYGNISETISLENLNTSSVVNMTNMFEFTKVTSLDVTNFDTSNVTDMSGMFARSNIATIKGLENFNTSNVIYMDNMFAMNKITELNLNNFITKNVKYMSYMFQGYQGTILDLSSFDTNNVINMNSMFWGLNNIKTIYVSNKFNTGSVTDSDYMFDGCNELVGGAGTVYDANHVDKEYAHIDGGTSNPGYFTDIANKPSEPNSFATDSWPTIINAVKNNNIGKYNVGDTKEIDMGTYGTHTLRIANTTTPSECSTEGFSQTACGFVLEFADIITAHSMNDTDINVGGWPASSMYTFVNTDIYNAIPEELRNGIIDTLTVSRKEQLSTDIYTSTDKLYLLAPKEVWGDYKSNYDGESNLTRQLDYYNNKKVTTSNYSEIIKENEGSVLAWWLRTPYSWSHNFYDVSYNGSEYNNYSSYNYGVSPAFRIG